MSIDVLMGDVDVATLQSLLYLEPLEVEGVDVHFAERFPHVMSAVWTVTIVVGVDKHSGDHPRDQRVQSLRSCFTTNMVCLLYCRWLRGWKPGSESVIG